MCKQIVAVKLINAVNKDFEGAESLFTIRIRILRGVEKLIHAVNKNL
jgi:hypothetical protein